MKPSVFTRWHSGEKMKRLCSKAIWQQLAVPVGLGGDWMQSQRGLLSCCYRHDRLESIGNCDWSLDRKLTNQKLCNKYPNRRVQGFKMADDELEYHVTFPSPTSSEKTNEGAEVDFFEDSCDHSEPVVILLGWSGCQDKHLAKYSAIYEARGCITIRYTAPVKDIFFNKDKLKSIAIKVMELIFDLSLEENPIFFHIFSNGGCFVYRYITEFMHSDDQPSESSMIQVKGCVFDSCPSPRQAGIAAKAFTRSLQTNALFTAIAYIAIYLYFFFVILLSKLFGFSEGDSYIQAMKLDRAKWPQMFLYSKADEIVPYMSVGEVVEHRKSLGIPVDEVCWDDSPHVQHMRVHREAYISQCYDFLDRCLARA